MGKITIDYNHPLHRTTSYILGANRNHLSDEYNLEGKMDAYRRIQPTFGEKKKLYRLGHGPTDGRLDEPHRYMTGYHFEEYWDKAGPYPYDDLRYGLREAKKMDCDLTVVVNYGSGTPEEAGRLVSYLNKNDDETRNRHGDEPWNVRYFELGNEVTWRLQVGHDPHCLSPEIYAKRCKEFAREMRRNSDIPIKIGMVASINGNWRNDHWENDESGDRMHNLHPFFEHMGDDLDFIIYHGYPELKKSDLDVMTSNQWFTDKLSRKVIPTVLEAQKSFGLSHPVEIANSEFFSEGYMNTHHQDTLEALYAADTMATCINLNIIMAVGFCFSFHTDSHAIAQDLFFLEGDPQQPSALFRVHELVAQHLGEWVLPSTGADLPSSPREELDGGRFCHIAHAATKLEDGSLAILVVNRTEQDAEIEIDPGFTYRTAEIISLDGGNYTNKHPARREEALASLAAVRIPAASVSIVRVHP